MKISRMSEETLAPSWAFEDVEHLAPSEFMNRYITAEEIERVESLPLNNLTEDQIIEQREVIEKCADSKSLYHYNSQWSDSVQSSLKEYAMACGMDMSKFKAVHPEYIESIKVVSNTEVAMRKEANIKNDPFKLDTVGDMEHMKESNWQDIHKQSNLNMRPSMEGSVIPLRGGEDYYANSDNKTARGQNSITEPDAIETFANSDEEDTGSRLRRENEDRLKARAIKHERWEQDKIASMEGTEDLFKGSVFATEVMNAQPGLNSDKIHMGVYSDFDLKDMPDQTDGERLAGRNEERRQEIQGSPKETYEFQPESHQARCISDTFAEALKKHIK